MNPDGRVRVGDPLPYPTEYVQLIFTLECEAQPLDPDGGCLWAKEIFYFKSLFPGQDYPINVGHAISEARRRLMEAALEWWLTKPGMSLHLVRFDNWVVPAPFGAEEAWSRQRARAYQVELVQSSMDRILEGIDGQA